MYIRALLCGVVMLVSCRGGNEPSPADDSAVGEDLKVPTEITENFVPTRWGETDRIDVNLDFKAEHRPADDDGVCIRITYRPHEQHWGAVYWQTKKELGVRKPVRFPAHSRIAFWARGETGEEVVEFRMPADPSSELLTHGELAHLGTQWKHYELEIGERAGKPVTGVFGVRWKCVTDQNKRGLTFYLDALRIE